MTTRPTIEWLRARDALEIKFFHPSTQNWRSRAQQAEAGIINYFDGYRRELLNKGLWPGLVALTIDQHRLIIQYRSGFPNRVEKIQIFWTSSVVHRRQAWRPWFICPGCGAKRTYLVNALASYRCRRCIYGGSPAYDHDRLSVKKRLQRTLKRIYNRLGGRDSDHPGTITRPKYMIKSCFHRLRGTGDRKGAVLRSGSVAVEISGDAMVCIGGEAQR